VFINLKSLELEVTTFCLVTGCVSARRDRRYPFSRPVSLHHVLRIDFALYFRFRMQTGQTPKFIANFEMELSVASSLTLPPDSLPLTHPPRLHDLAASFLPPSIRSLHRVRKIRCSARCRPPKTIQDRERRRQRLQ
jgi:hypothetical protein